MLNLHEPIFVHRYTLRSKKPLNALTGRLEHEGALVRIGDGVGALQPWPELGDLPLERQLRILAQGGFTSHLERLRVCCKLDGAARRQQRSEFRDFTAPPSHVYEPDAARIVKEGGLSADAVLRALTIDAARLAGAGDRLGTIETGKIANLIVTQGDLFDGGSIRHVVIDGLPANLDAPAPQGGGGRGRGGGAVKRN